MVKCDTRIEDAGVNETKLHIGITFHRLGLIVGASTGLISILLAEYLIFQHARHYLKPLEQKHIIRILFMIPVYSAVSFLSYYYYKHAIYYQVLRDCYEAFAIASFFTLLCNYIAPSLHDQKDFFRKSTPVNWIWPMPWFQKCTGGQNRGIFRKPVSGLTWFNIIYVCVFQYCFIRVFFTVVSVIAQANDRYCESSLSPAFAHIWVLVFEGLSVTIAMYGLIQFYVQLKPDLAPHKPFLKLTCIKLVIFFCFWQNLVISFLSSKYGPLHPTKYLSWPDINVGITSVLVTCEMVIFAILHLFAFPWRKPYGQPHTHTTEFEAFHAPGSGFSGKQLQYTGGFLGWKAIVDAFNPWDIIKASGRGFRWLFVGARHRREDISYSRPGGTAAESGPYGGGAGAATYGYAPPRSHSNEYDSLKLQPITGSYPMVDGPSHHRNLSTDSQSSSTAYKGSTSQVGAKPGSDRPSNRTDDPWRSDISIDAYGRPRGKTGRQSPSPSPAPQGRALYDGQEQDRAGLLKYAGKQQDGSPVAETHYQALGPDPGYHGSTPHRANFPRELHSDAVPPRGMTQAQYGHDDESSDHDDDDDDDDDDVNDDYAQARREYRGRYSAGSIGVAKSTDHGVEWQPTQQQQQQAPIGIHPAFRGQGETQSRNPRYGNTPSRSK